MKRTFDFVVAAIAQVVVLPLWLVIAAVIKYGSQGPILYRALRVGKDGRVFTMYKFRTMVTGDSSAGPRVTREGDPRVTTAGRWLRRTKLDELPQLINVLRGDMSLVGPRPEDPLYVATYSDEQRRVLSIRPGMVGPAALEFRHEEALLVAADRLEHAYVEVVLPIKLRVDLEYIDRRSFWADMSILARAAACLLGPIVPRRRFLGVLLRHRRPLIVLAHGALVTLALVLAFALRFDFSIPPEELHHLVKALPLLLVIRGIVFYRLHLFEGLWRYVSLRDLLAILTATGIGSALFISAELLLRGYGFPRSVFVLEGILTFMLVGGVRLPIRALRERRAKSRVAPIRALVVGGGDAADMLLRSLQGQVACNYEVVGLVDDHRGKRGMRVRGVPVLGTTGDIASVAASTGTEEVLVAIPSASPEDRNRIMQRCRAARLPVRVVPSLRELVEGGANIGQLRDVAPEELMARDGVVLDLERLRTGIRGKRILVTGAGGSIGSELCRQIAPFRPASLVLFDRAESPLYMAYVELAQRYPGIDFHPIVGDIMDPRKLHEAMDEHRPQLVYHAAAYKHVPLMELHPLEAIANNVFGTEAVAAAARRVGAERFVFISTDKAVRPVGVMGMTKRVAEGVLRSQPNRGGAFITVRFGNVLGSDGSILPILKHQLARNGSVTVTDPNATRYFMLISEAAQLVLEAGLLGSHGDIFFLDMGEPVNIGELATDLIHLSGLLPGRDVEVLNIGLRPGERLREELIGDAEELVTGGPVGIFRLSPKELDVRAFSARIETLHNLVASRDLEAALAELKDVASIY